ncbi:excalibur calcium-binding domain-containing protein [Metabacillus litoralis]|uniref:Excalibur calcium-binding domain-containing protein n=1 Tax=Metabacillus litoralis TaxID=152268 RepID=A0A179SUN5_9BACI|nr:excalibur calcium-binding domain-containing protein [Metabacillus litoralis]OAS85104.1 hypothetical protein A6K24_06225 [Metabacillus litoralis]
MDKQDKEKIIERIKKEPGIIKEKLITEFSNLGIEKVSTFVNQSKEITKKQTKDGVRLYIKNKGCLGCLFSILLILLIGSCVGSFNDDNKEKEEETIQSEQQEDSDKEDTEKTEQKEEAERLAEEQRKKEEAERLAEEQRKKEEAERLAEEQRKKEEAERLAEEQRQAEQQQTNVYYKNCDEARSAGAAPVHQGEPGYGKHLDRDGDGVGCDR